MTRLKGRELQAMIFVLLQANRDAFTKADLYELLDHRATPGDIRRALGALRRRKMVWRKTEGRGWIKRLMSFTFSAGTRYYHYRQGVGVHA